MQPPEEAPRVRTIVHVRGTVQGVGFRPFACRLARSLGLAGTVRNVGGGVELEVEGPRDRVAELLRRLEREAPALARIEAVTSREHEAAGLAGLFAIAASAGGSGSLVPIPPDAGPCAACLAELASPGDRRYRYPFVSCTDCGPRFTVARELPYDRARTTYDRFPVCAECAREYADPADRRFHAETQACPRCGPTLRFDDGAGEGTTEGPAAIERARALVRGGGVLALLGVGGFQLACDARSPTAIARLRERKGRPEKPFALMVRDLAAASRIVALPEGARAALASPERPIVLLPRLDPADLEGVAPALPELGVMLPASPLHALLLEGTDAPWLLTSGNRHDEPIARDEASARRALGDMAQGFLCHDRAIHARADDSVVQLHFGRVRVLRRARGFVPRSIALPAIGPDLVALGGDLKATVCVVREGRAVVSQHLGDLSSPEVEAFLRETVDHLVGLLGARPRAVACDRHPDYASTRIARDLGLEIVPVQHHHAHAAACLAEHGRPGPALAVALDGSGFGDDGTVWGGELLLASLTESRRLGRLRPVALPGGDAAAREPWRAAVAHLADAGVEHALAGVEPGRAELVRTLARKRVAAPLASSAGRLFDAVAAIAGVRLERGYEGQAAILLEAAAAGAPGEPYPVPLASSEGLLELDTRPLIRAVVRDRARGASPREVSRRFHAGLATALAGALERLREKTAVSTAVLVGGCFQNRLLLSLVTEGLEARGFLVLAPALYPAGDGGLSLGQAAVASARLAL
jgi:hydrogenase maturation protein HypF